MDEIQALLTWVNSVTHSTSSTMDDLVDGFKINQILIENILGGERMDSEFKREEMWAEVLAHLVSFYRGKFENVDKAFVVENLGVDVEKIVRDNNENEMLKVLRLVLVAAFYGDRKDFFIKDLERQSDEYQSIIRKIIREEMESYKSRSNIFPFGREIVNVGDSKILAEKMEKRNGSKELSKKMLISLLEKSKFEFEKSKHEMAEYQEQIEQLTKISKHLEEEVKQKTSLCINLQKKQGEFQQASLETMNKEGTWDNSSSFEAVRELRKNLIENQATISQLEKQVHTLQQEVKYDNELREEVEQLRVTSNRARELEFEIKAIHHHNESIERLKNQIENSQLENDVILHDKLVLDQSLPKLKQKIEKYKQRIIYLSTTDHESVVSLTSQDQKIIQLQTQLDISKADTQKLEEEIQILKQKLTEQSEFTDKIINQKFESHEVSGSIPAEIKEKLFSLEIENKILKEKTVEDSLEIKEELEIQTTLANRLKQELTNLKVQFQQINVNHSHLIQQNDNLSQQIQNVTQSLEQSQQELRQCKDDLRIKLQHIQEIEENHEHSHQQHEADLSLLHLKLKNIVQEKERLSDERNELLQIQNLKEINQQEMKHQLNELKKINQQEMKQQQHLLSQVSNQYKQHMEECSARKNDYIEVMQREMEELKKVHLSAVEDNTEKFALQSRFLNEKEALIKEYRIQCEELQRTNDEQAIAAAGLLKQLAILRTEKSQLQLENEELNKRHEIELHDLKKLNEAEEKLKNYEEQSKTSVENIRLLTEDRDNLIEKLKNETAMRISLSKAEEKLSVTLSQKETEFEEKKRDWVVEKQELTQMLINFEKKLNIVECEKEELSNNFSRMSSQNEAQRMSLVLKIQDLEKNFSFEKDYSSRLQSEKHQIQQQYITSESLRSATSAKVVELTSERNSLKQKLNDAYKESAMNCKSWMQRMDELSYKLEEEKSSSRQYVNSLVKETSEKEEMRDQLKSALSEAENLKRIQNGLKEDFQRRMKQKEIDLKKTWQDTLNKQLENAKIYGDLTKEYAKKLEVANYTIVRLNKEKREVSEEVEKLKFSLEAERNKFQENEKENEKFQEKSDEFRYPSTESINEISDSDVERLSPEPNSNPVGEYSPKVTNDENNISRDQIDTPIKLVDKPLQPLTDVHINKRLPKKFSYNRTPIRNQPPRLSNLQRPSRSRTSLRENALAPRITKNI